jgi:hypothetical protein
MTLPCVLTVGIIEIEGSTVMFIGYWNRGSSVDTTKGYRLEGRGSIPGR